MLVRFARCCEPLPGDDVVGFVTRGRGVTVHRRDCPKVFELDPERRIDVEWEPRPSDAAQDPVRVRSVDQPGLLAKVTKAISAPGSTSAGAKVTTNQDKQADPHLRAVGDRRRHPERGDEADRADQGRTGRRTRARVTPTLSACVIACDDERHLGALPGVAGLGRRVHRGGGRPQRATAPRPWRAELGAHGRCATPTRGTSSRRTSPSSAKATGWCRSTPTSRFRANSLPGCAPRLAERGGRGRRLRARRVTYHLGPLDPPRRLPSGLAAAGSSARARRAGWAAIRTAASRWTARVGASPAISSTSSYRDLADQVERIRRFSEIEARAMLAAGRRVRLRDLVLRPPARFCAGLCAQGGLPGRRSRASSSPRHDRLPRLSQVRPARGSCERARGQRPPAREGPPRHERLEVDRAGGADAGAPARRQRARGARGRARVPGAASRCGRRSWCEQAARRRSRRRCWNSRGAGVRSPGETAARRGACAGSLPGGASTSSTPGTRATTCSRGAPGRAPRRRPHAPGAVGGGAEPIADRPWNRWLFGRASDGLLCVSPTAAAGNARFRAGRSPSPESWGRSISARFAPGRAGRRCAFLARPRAGAPRGRNRRARAAAPAFRPAARRLRAAGGSRGPGAPAGGGTRYPSGGGGGRARAPPRSGRSG